MSLGVKAIAYPTSDLSKKQPCRLFFPGSHHGRPCMINLDTQHSQKPSVYLQYTRENLELLASSISIEDIPESVRDQLGLNTVKKKSYFRTLSLRLKSRCPVKYKNLDECALPSTFINLARQVAIEIVVDWKCISRRHRESLTSLFKSPEDPDSSDNPARPRLEDNSGWITSPNIDDLITFADDSVSFAAKSSLPTTEPLLRPQAISKNTGKAIPEPPPLYTSELGSGSDLSALVYSAASIRTGGATPVPQVLELKDGNFPLDTASFDRPPAFGTAASIVDYWDRKTRGWDMESLPDTDDGLVAGRKFWIDKSSPDQNPNANLSKGSYLISNTVGSVGGRRRGAKLTENTNCDEKKRKRFVRVANDSDGELGPSNGKRQATQNCNCHNHRTGEGPTTYDTLKTHLDLDVRRSLDDMVRHYCRWQQSRVTDEDLKRNTYWTGEWAVGEGYDLKQVSNLKAKLLIKQGVLPGVAGRFIDDAGTWLQEQERDCKLSAQSKVE